VGKFTIKIGNAMRGMFNGRSAGNQLLLTVSFAAVSFFVLGMAGTFILSAITGISANVILNPAIFTQKREQALFFIRGMQFVQFVGLFLVPSFLAAYFFSTNTKSYLGFKKPYVNMYWMTGILTLMIALPLVQWLGELNREIPFSPSIAKWIGDKEDSADQTVKALLSNQSLTDLLLNLFFIAGLAAIGEELLFRGVLQRLFIKQFRNPWAGILMAAFLFSALHMQFYGFLPRFVLGVLLGAVYWYSGSLWIAILTHFLYDGLLVSITYFDPTMLNDDKQIVSASALMVSGLLSALFVTMNIHWMLKNTNASYETFVAEESEQNPTTLN
jgi:membrane protease YdiL (CAAX protease family)